MKKNNRRTDDGLAAFYIILLVCFGILLALGTFIDESLAIRLYSPDQIFIMYVSSIGAFPFFCFAVLFLGILCEKIIHSDKNKAARVILCAICYLLAAAVGFIGAGALVDKDCLGYVYPSLNRNIPVIAGIAVVVNPLLLILGYSLGKKADDKNLSKRIICVLILLALAFVCNQVFKSIFHRPRFRLVQEGYEEIGFWPWYKPFPGSAGLIEKYGIDKGEFRSFPSGHSILSMTMIFVLPSLTWFSGKLKNKRLLFGIAGLLFAVITMLTRLILGAHYLSDVSAGAVISCLLALLYFLFEKKASA